jgi:hypothetical protein
VVFCNDTVGALAALRKGSSASGVLERLAAEFSVLTRDAEVDSVFLHAPGVDLIQEDIDAASRAGMLALHGPAFNQDAVSLVHALAFPLDWRISIDLFASRTNTIAQRSFAQFAELDAEGRDARHYPAGIRRDAPTAAAFIEKWVWPSHCRL